ncbi:MAG TPA: hypothetical protein DEP35_00045 [Deltaproteobacteria bacterium]|nr:hypothetical protein [Deltaproteobacteria bacterium]
MDLGSAEAITDVRLGARNSDAPGDVPGLRRCHEESKAQGQKEQRSEAGPENSRHLEDAGGAEGPRYATRKTIGSSHELLEIRLENGPTRLVEPD